MASLVGQQLKDTYDSLLKTSDNDALGGTYKEITDGSGNSSNLYLGTSGSVGIGSAPTSLLQLEQSIVPRITLIKTGVLSWYLGNVLQGSDNNFTIGTDSGGNTNILTLDTSGRVGIGASPDSNLKIMNNDGSSYRFGYGGTSDVYLDTDNIYFRSDNGGANYGILQSGKLGLGTNLPSEKLEVQDGSISVGSSTNTSTTNALLSGYGYILSGTKIGNTSIKSTYNNSNNSASLEFYTDPNGSTPTERLRIDSSGNTSIYSGVLNLGTDSVASSLNFIGDVFNIGVDSDGNTGGSPSIRFNVSGSEKARIDSSGNVLVGKTDANNTSQGNYFQASDGFNSMVSTSNTSLLLNRLTTDGTLLLFRKDGTTVGSIGSTSGVISHIILDPRSSLKGAGILGASIDANTGIIQPCDRAGAVADNAINLGSTSNRWKNLYLGGGIYLGGTGSDNFLDDYEEGTWTPVYTPANNSFTTMTMNVVSATYTKIGRQVTARAYITTNEVVVGTASGGLNIDGLPFTSASGNDGFSSVSIGYVTNWGTVPNTGYVRSNNTEIRLRRSTGANDSSPSDLTTGATANQNQIMITATYFV